MSKYFFLFFFLKIITYKVGVIAWCFLNFSCQNSSVLNFTIELLETDKTNGLIVVNAELKNVSDHDLLIFKPLKGFTLNDSIRRSDGEDLSYRISITPEFNPDLYLILKSGDAYSWFYSIEEESTGIPQAGDEPFKFEQGETYSIQLFYWSDDWLHPSNYFTEFNDQATFFEENVESNIITLKY
ncbi:MAG TPA: hypothetical protein VJ917_04260 [Saprospiraceae bacterium]|nr:hypothetical protein [Saprospiraceae bacterium]